MRTSFVLGIVLLWNGLSCPGADVQKAAEEARAQVLKALRQARAAWRELRRQRAAAAP